MNNLNFRGTEESTIFHCNLLLTLQGIIEFDTGETLKTIDIEIINDHMFEKDETFMVELTEVKTEGAKLGRLRRTVVTIVSDDGKLRLRFSVLR